MVSRDVCVSRLSCSETQEDFLNPLSPAAVERRERVVGGPHADGLTIRAPEDLPSNLDGICVAVYDCYTHDKESSETGKVWKSYASPCV